MATYIALVHQDRDSQYGVRFPDVPGCTSGGKTFEEAVANAADALAEHLVRLSTRGDPLPAPRSFEEFRRDPEFSSAMHAPIVTVVKPAPMEEG